MIRGSCLCGAVRYEATTPAGPMGACHCTICRRAHGSAFASVQPVARTGFRFTAGESELCAYESSPGKRRWFCGRCGSQIVSTRDDDDEKLLLRAGCVDEGLAAGPVAHGWVGSMAPWYEITDALPRFERGFPGSPPGVED